MKISKKKMLAIVLTLTTFLAMFTVLRPAVATEFIDVDNYCWIEGVLDSDTYALYPYAEESVDFGFSKYGELIGYNEEDEIGLGIQYPGYTGAADPDDAPDGTYDQRIGTSVDPFCNEEIGVDWWMRGWFIDIKYTPLGAADREIWAFAMFSDGSKHGGDWIVMPSVGPSSAARPLWQEHPPYANPDSTAYLGIVSPIPESGGRKTNGYCETEPIEIIYNGPRRFVAICRTRISDVGAAADLLDLTFTFIFNKAEKNVIILKDVKRLYKKSPMNIQFGNRGEWDLGISPDTDSYIHWYTDEPVQYWDMDGLGTITCAEEETSFEFFKKYFLAYKHPKKWWDDVPDWEIPDMVCDEWTEEMIDFPEEWLETQETCYGREWHMDDTIKEHSYAVAQVITQAGDYVGAYAVWPHPEFWAAHNLYYPPYRTTLAGGGNNPSSLTLMLRPISRMLEWNKWTVVEDPTSDDYPHGYLDDRSDVWVKVDDVVTATGATKEPIIPFTIAEHDFELSSSLPAYRIVSIYILTDNHDGDDADALGEAWSNGVNVIDREIQYQLDEIFDPWDINDAMHKNTKRWVQFFDRDYLGYAWDGETTWCLQLDDTREVEYGKEIPSLPVYRDGDWDAYCAFSERVLVDTGTGFELIYPYVYNWLDPIPNDDSPFYTITLATGLICFWEYDDDLGYYVPWYLPEDSVVKVLWSSEHHATTAEQWDENTLLVDEQIDGVNFRFPLHHDITPAYKPDTEVLLIEEGPVRLLPGAREGPYYVAIGDTITVYGVPICSEVDVKYYTTTDTSAWIEEKFHVGRTPMDLAFVIDITGSMIDELGEFQTALSDILDAAEAWSGGDIRYSLVTFGDTITVDQDWTTTRSTIETVIAGLVGGGGGYCPEASDEALNTVVNELSARTGQTGDFSAWRERVHKRVIIFTDAPPGGFDDTYQASDLANAKTQADTAATKGIVISSIEGDTTCDGAVTTEALQYYATVTGGVYLKLDGVNIADAVEAAFEGFTFTLSYPPHYIEKVWYHSEKALLGGDYVFNNATQTLYMQEAVPDGEWLIVAYTVNNIAYLDFFLGDGSTNVFMLHHGGTVPTMYADVGSLYVYNTDIWQQIVHHEEEEQEVYYAVPKTSPCWLNELEEGTYEGKLWERFGVLEEREWLVATDIKVRGNWIIRETCTCDELVLDQPPLPGQELKIVFKVPSGRWEWGAVGEPSVAVDSIGSEMVVAAFKNKLMEFGLGGLDVQDPDFGPRIPWLITEESPDSIGRYHLRDDWCSYYEAVPDDSWPISSSNIITVGGPYPNMVSKYFNEFAQAMIFTTVGDGFYAVTCWDKALSEYGFYAGGKVTDRYGYAVISTYKDKNGTIGFTVYGWTGQDTYYAAKWFDENKFWLQHLNLHVTDLILEIEYKDSDGVPYCPPTVSIVEKLGTISEKPQHDC